MSSLGSVLKNEITRLARKEIRVQVEPLRKASANYRREIASLKRQLDDLARQAKTQSKAARPVKADAAPAEGSKVRFSAKGIRSLRERLGLSQEALGTLVGSSGQSVFNWENGVKPRASSLEALCQLRAIGKREAQARLEALQNAPTAAKRRKTSAT